MIGTYLKLCLLELSEKMTPGGGEGAHHPSPPPPGQFFHPVHTYFIFTYLKFYVICGGVMEIKVVAMKVVAMGNVAM